MKKMKKAIVLGGGGFIGGHLAKYLKENEQNKLDALKKIEGIPTLEEINQIALKTYTSNGYAELDRRELIPFPFSQDLGDIILMGKNLGA